MPTISIDLTAQQAQRLSDAYKALISPDAEPTVADLKEYIVKQLRNLVLRHERQEALKEATTVEVPPFEPA